MCHCAKLAQLPKICALVRKIVALRFLCHCQQLLQLLNLVVDIVLLLDGRLLRHGRLDRASVLHELGRGRLDMTAVLLRTVGAKSLV